MLKTIDTTPVTTGPIQFNKLSAQQSVNVLQQLLDSKRSADTRRTYASCLRHFFSAVAGRKPDAQVVDAFLKLPRDQALATVLGYRAQLLADKYAPSSINTRLSAIKSLASYAQELGHCDWNLQAVKLEKVVAYRDTSGVGVEQFKKVLATCDRATVVGRRDYALLRLLWDNSLRRNELHLANIESVDAEAKRVWIYGKGTGQQQVSMVISAKTLKAISAMLADRNSVRPEAPLFVSYNRASPGTNRLSRRSVYSVVRSHAEQAGLSKILSPHKVRHSSITYVLDKTNGNYRKARAQSRHKDIRVVMVYDDNRLEGQTETTSLLSDAV